MTCEGHYPAGWGSFWGWADFAFRTSFTPRPPCPRENFKILKRRKKKSMSDLEEIMGIFLEAKKEKT